MWLMRQATTFYDLLGHKTQRLYKSAMPLGWHSTATTRLLLLRLKRDVHRRIAEVYPTQQCTFWSSHKHATLQNLSNEATSIRTLQPGTTYFNAFFTRAAANKQSVNRQLTLWGRNVNHMDTSSSEQLAQAYIDQEEEIAATYNSWNALLQGRILIPQNFEKMSSIKNAPDCLFCLQQMHETSKCRMIPPV